MGNRKDIQDFMMAMSLGWNITDDQKAVMLERCNALIARDPNSRSAIRAMECLIKMEEQNIRIAESNQTKLSIKMTAPYEQMSAEQNESIVEDIISGILPAPSLEE